MTRLPLIIECVLFGLIGLVAILLASITLKLLQTGIVYAVFYVKELVSYRNSKISDWINKRSK
jgi:hypothetical protein